MSTTSPMIARAQLQTEIDAALGSDATAAQIVDLVIRSGWQPRPTPDPNSEYLEGRLASGASVPIEIRHAFAGRIL